MLSARQMEHDHTLPICSYQPSTILRPFSCEHLTPVLLRGADKDQTPLSSGCNGASIQVSLHRPMLETETDDSCNLARESLTRSR